MSRKIIFVFLVCCLVGCGQRDKEVRFQGVEEKNNYVQQGMQYLQQKDVANAIKSFDTAIKADPKNPDNYITLGQVYFALKNYTRAIDTFTAATNVAPANGKAHYLLAVSRKERNQEGDLSKAIEATQRSIICFRKIQDEQGFTRAAALYKNLTETGRQQEAQEQTQPTMEE